MIIPRHRLALFLISLLFWYLPPPALSWSWWGSSPSPPAPEPEPLQKQPTQTHFYTTTTISSQNHPTPSPRLPPCTFTFNSPPPGSLIPTTFPITFTYTHTCTTKITLKILTRSPSTDIIYHPDSNENGEFHVGPFTVGTHFIIASSSTSELGRTHVNAIPPLLNSESSSSSTSTMPSLKSLRPLSVAEVAEDDPIRLTKKSVVFVGQR